MVAGKAVAPGVHGGDMENAPTVPVRSATSMMSGAVRRMRSVSAPMFVSVFGGCCGLDIIEKIEKYDWSALAGICVRR